MSIKASDQIALLKASAKFTETGKWEGVFTYPGCGYDLVKCGLADENGNITIAGRAALFLIGEGDDPTPESKSSITFSISLPSSPEEPRP